jgi:hypothetical protein
VKDLVNQSQTSAKPRNVSRHLIMSIRVKILLCIFSFNGSNISFSQSTEFEKVANFVETINISEEINPESLIKLKPNEDVLGSFLLLKVNEFPSFESYITLYYLKVYYFHLKCCNQAYDLRTANGSALKLDCDIDKLLCEFMLLSKQDKSKDKIEFISSRLGFEYYLNNPKFENNNSIAQVVSLIIKKENEINNRLGR